MAEALYRKYRPQVFEDVVGQEPIERTLKNAIMQDKVSHAYLFCGPRGTGKTTTARLLAKALLCQSGPTPDPDGTCEDCLLIADGVHPDVYELDAASRTGVENVREEIISRVQFAPTRGRSKVYIIDEVHMLSTAAFNALLKTLEEPPSHVVFVLCTTDPQKVPETIHSRCQRFDFRRIAPESMVSRLGAICIAEGVEFEGEALDLIAHRADGGLRNALTSLEQIIAFENGRVTLAGAERLLGSIDSNDMAEIVSYVGKRDIANCFRWTADYVETGADLAQFVRDMAEHVRNLYVLALVGDDADLDISETMRHQMIVELQWFGPDRLARLLGVLGDLSSELKTSSNPRLAFEIALTRMVRPDSDLTLEALAERVEALESGYSAVAHVVPGPRLPHGAAGVGEWEGAANAAAPATGYAAQPAREAAAFEPIADGAPTAMRIAGGGSESREGAGQPVRPVETIESQAPVQDRGFAREQAQGQFANRGQVQVQVGAETQPQAAVQPQPQQTVPVQVGGADAADAGVLGALANPATMQRAWQAALSAVKKKKQAYGVLFMNTKARFDDAAGAVRVMFPAEAAFAFSAVQKPDVQDALSEALSHAVGAPVPFLLERAGQAVVGADVARNAAVGQQRDATARDFNVPQRAAGGQASAQQAVQPTADSASAAQQGANPAVATPAQQGANQASATPDWQGANQASATPMAQDGSPGANLRQFPQDDMVPYEQVPYDEGLYDEVPYEELESFGAAPSASAPLVEPARQRNAAVGERLDARAAAPIGSSAPGADAATSASPDRPNLTPEGGIAEDPADVQALLQAGFGGGVVFSEIQE